MSTVRKHVYDGERCIHCGVNIYDQYIYGPVDESDCIERAPMVYTTETGQHRCRHCGEPIEYLDGNVNAWVEIAEDGHYDQCPDHFVYEDGSAVDVGGPHEPLREVKVP